MENTIILVRMSRLARRMERGHQESRDSEHAGKDDLLALDDESLVRRCRVDCFRSSGPGGQKRNKTSSGVRLTHEPTGLVVTAVEDRSQHVNRRRAARRMREAIALHLRTPLDMAKYSPGELLSTCISADGAIVVGRRDARYAPAIREILDVLAACGMRVGETAGAMGSSTGQLASFLQKDEKLWRRVNDMRAEAGQKPLR